MKLLLVIHVLSAVLGLGPAYAFPFVLRSTQSVREMTGLLALVARLETFPKAFGSLAVLSGLLLVWLGSYGSFLQLWLIGTLAIYIALEVIVIGFMAPATKSLQAALTANAPSAGDEPSAAIQRLYSRVRSLHTWVCAVSLLIFILMIVKP